MDELDRLRADNARLRAGIRRVVETLPRTPDTSMPFGKCVRGVPPYETCGQCTDDALLALLDDKPA
jgi:hypothetical protein